MFNQNVLVTFKRDLERLNASPEQIIFLEDHPENDVMGEELVKRFTIFRRTS